MRYTYQTIAVIPNYNMGKSLCTLIDSILTQRYNAIYVLDDASTDTSLALLKKYGNAISVIAGTSNVGSGANRNRILSHLTDPTHTIIHFLDADTTITRGNVPDLSDELFANPATAIVGGLVLTKNGQPFVWNWAKHLSIAGALATTVAHYLLRLSVLYPRVARILWALGWPLLHDKPSPYKESIAQQVRWVSEANMLIRADMFKKIGGFDEQLRVHDIFDVAIKIKKLGLACYYDPRFAVQHHEINVRPSGRAMQEKAALKYLIRKHGLSFFG